MIGSLEGVLNIKKPPFILLNVSGVGYEIQVSMNTFYKLPEINQKVQLLTHLSVREDGFYLFGFISEDERFLFKELIKINGVGPKLALAILSGMEVQSLVHVIQIKECSKLVKIPGVGKKTAERLLIELGDKFNKKGVFSEFSEEIAIASKNINHSIKEDAIDALISLGYRDNEARNTIAKIEGTNCEDLIRKALKII